MKNIEIVSKVVSREGEAKHSPSKDISSANLSDYLLKSIWDKVFEIRTDSQGTEYIFGKLPMVTQYGITMYSGDGVDIPSLASGLPFDGRTIWYNPDTKQIEVIGGTGGGSGEGVSNFWDLSGIPSWITNSKPKYTYSEIEGTPDLTKYALVSQIPSLSGYATESWVTKQNYATKATTLSGYGITDAYTKTNVDDLLKSYVTLGGTPQTITGEKNFTGGLKVNGSPIYYDSAKKYWKLEGDLLVTGGVTMYGSDSSFTPSTIMNAILYDNATLGIDSNGQLYVKGGAGGGINTTDLQNYLTQNSYLNVTSGDNRYLKLSGGDLSGNIFINTYASNRTAQSYIRFNKGSAYFGMGASASNISIFSLGTVNGDNTWKKEVIQFYDNGTVNFLTSPTVDANNVLHAGNYSLYALPLSGGTMNGVITMPINYQIQWGSSSMMIYGEDVNAIKIVAPLGLYVNSKEVWHEGNFTPSNYLPLSGGTINSTFGRLEIKRNNAYASAIKYSNTSGVLGYIGFNDNFNPMLWNKNQGELGVIIHSGNIGSYNAGSATKLQTPRTIWGQSFDGTGNVSGNLTLENNYEIVTKATSGSISSTLYRTKSNNLSIGEGIAKESNDTYISGNNLFLRYGTGLTNGISLISSGNVGINTTSPSYKLHVNGDIRGSSIYGSNTYINTGGNGIYFSGSGIYYHGSNNSWISDLMYFTSAGNVGIGTTSPEYKLHVAGSGYYFGSLYLNRYGASGNKSGASLIINKGGDYFGIGSSNTNVSYMSFGTTSDTTGTWKSEIITITHVGTVGIGTSNPSSKLHVNGVLTLPLNNQVQWADSGGAMIYGTSGKRIMVDGDILATGAMTFYSMRKLKNVVDERGLSLSELSTIKPTRYTWKDGRDNRLHFGGIADDIQQVLPEVVYSTSDGILTMDYGNAAFAVASSLIHPVIDHEKRIAMLQKRIVELEEEVERLKSA